MSHTIDHTKGEKVDTVSAQWMTRPADQRFTNLYELRDQVALWASESRTIDVQPREIACAYDEEHPDSLLIEVGGVQIEPTHYAFDALCRAAAAPSAYIRSLPGPLAAVNLNYGLQTAEQKEVSAYVRQNGTTSLRGITSTRYGRIYDREVADAVIKVAGNGIGETRWKVPGTIDWGGAHGVTYNPEVDVTKDNTTLYASDRDIFLFLVDDLNPIEVGKLANGDPDLMFRGFYCWNSEVGSKSFGFASMYLRGVCQNRNLWGVEGFEQMVFNHTALAPSRFIAEAEPALLAYANSSENLLRKGVLAAKKAKVAHDEDTRLHFLAGHGFSEKAGRRVIDTFEREEGYLPCSVWDFSQGITAVARREEYQEARVALERIAGRLLDKIKVD